MAQSTSTSSKSKNTRSQSTGSKSTMNSTSTKKHSISPAQKSTFENFKTEVASSLNIDLKQGYNGDITAKEAGSIGGEMVKRMIAYAENNMK